MSFELNWRSNDRDDEDRPRFVPGDQVEGSVSWSLNEPLDGLHVGLLFECVGKGTPQQESAATNQYSESGLRGQVAFSFTAPDWPWSFSGKLVSLVWKIQAFSANAGLQEEWPLIISPSRSEIDLYAYKADGEPLGKGWRRSQRMASLRSGWGKRN